MDNGFDQWDQITMLNKEILKEIKMPNQYVDKILTIIQNISLGQQSIRTQSLTIEMMTKGLNKKKDYSKKPPLSKKENLATAAVLSLNGLGIDQMDDCIYIAAQLQILHLYDNNLSCLFLKELPLLRILNVQNNKLTSISIDTLSQLEKVYLDRNRLDKMPLLPPKITTITISNQQVKDFQFPDDAFENCLYSLQHLTCESSNVDFAITLGGLVNLETLNLKNNRIKEFDDIEDSLPSLQNIKEIDLRGNPITKLHKYRDRIALLCKSIQTLDDKNILVHERQFLINLGKQKIMKRNQSLEQPKQKVEKPSVFGFKEKIRTIQNSQQEFCESNSKSLTSGKYFNDGTHNQITKKY